MTTNALFVIAICQVVQAYYIVRSLRQKRQPLAEAEPKVHEGHE